MKIATGGMHSVEDVLETIVDLVVECRIEKRASINISTVLYLVEYLGEREFLRLTSRIAAWAVESEHLLKDGLHILKHSIECR